MLRMPFLNHITLPKEGRILAYGMIILTKVLAQNVPHKMYLVSLRTLEALSSVRAGRLSASF